MDASFLLTTLARQRLINALALGIPPEALSCGLSPFLVPGPIVSLPILAASQAVAASPEVETAASIVDWTPKEDALLKSLIEEHGTSKWSRIAAKMGSKTNRQCRRRWQAIMNSAGSKGSWTAEEDSKLLEGHRRYGNRWTDIARLVPGRTDNAVKNRFAALMAKGEGAKGAKVMRWSDVCASPKLEEALSAEDSPKASLKRKASLDSASSGSGSFSNIAASVPSLKRVRPEIDLDLNVAPSLAGAASHCLSGASEQESSQGSCIDAVDSPSSASMGFSLDLNFPASA